MPQFRFSLAWMCFVACCCAVAGQGLSQTRPVDDALSVKMVIVSAKFVDLAADNAIDVTTKVAAMVKDNNLSVDATKAKLGDAGSSGARKLKVGYTLDGIYHTKTVEEGETLDISTRLFVRKAIYGDLPKGQQEDVTEQVAERVRKNSLTVKADNETFGDPAEGVVKRLRVDYTLDGKRGSKTVTEGETLSVGEKGN
jgi:hypothetical protein